MVQHFLTWLDRNIGFDVDPDHARTRPGRFISRSFFSCGLTTKVHAPRVSMILTHHSRPATSTMTLFSFRYAACTPSSRKDSKKECEEIFDEPFFWGRGERNRNDDFDNDLSCLSIILFIITG